MPRGKNAKLARAVARRGIRGKSTMLPKKGKKKTRQDNNKTKESQQEWVGGSEWYFTNKLMLMMNSQGTTNPKHVLEVLKDIHMVGTRLKAHLQDQECK